MATYSRNQRIRMMPYGNTTVEVSAGGVLIVNSDKRITAAFYTQKQQKQKKKKDKWSKHRKRAVKNYVSDFGGKIERKDLSICFGVYRELVEESNGVFDNIKILNKIGEMYKEQQFLYIPQCKYILFILNIDEIDPDFSGLTNDVFGDHEIADGIPRTVQYMPMKEFLKGRFGNGYILNPRLSKCKFPLFGSLRRMYA